MENTLTCTPNQVKENVIRCIKAGLVPFIQSSPGIGKSSIVKQIAKEFNLAVIDHRLSTSAPEDLLGLPHFENGKAVFSPFRDVFPLSDTPLPLPYDGWLLFFDEFNSAPRSVQAACYKIILDREVGQFKLNKRCAIVCAGNLLDDNAITVNLSTAMQSRLVHIIMTHDFKQWEDNVAFPQQYDERIIGFLNMYPENLMKFDPEKVEHTFACPRTWEFVNRLIKNEPDLDDKDASWLRLLSGTITSEIAFAFLQYCKFGKEMISYVDILKDPVHATIPEKNEVKWSTILHLLNHVDKDNLEKIFKYVARYSIDYRIIFYRALRSRMPDVEEHPAFVAVRMELANFFE